jgi:hypothetical protein
MHANLPLETMINTETKTKGIFHSIENCQDVRSLHLHLR